MKNLKAIISIMIILFVGLTMNAQSPQTFNYQAVFSGLTDGDNITVSIPETSFSETHTLVVDENFDSSNGLISLVVGSVEDLSTVDWANSGSLTLKVQYNGNDVNTTLNSVPFALFANDVPVSLSGNDLTIGETTVALPSSSGGLHVPDNTVPVVINSATSPNDTLSVWNTDLMYDGNPTQLTWSQANGATYGCPSLGTGWRLPSRAEMDAIHKQSYLLTGFNYDMSYWTSEISSDNGHWSLYFKTGGEHRDMEDNVAYTRARCVKNN